MNLGEHIYRLRTQKNMSQGDLADALEVSRQSVSKWENNSAVPELEKLVKMAGLFGVSLDELVGSSPAKTEYPPVEIRHSPVPVRSYAGLALLCCSILSLVLFLVFGEEHFLCQRSSGRCQRLLSGSRRAPQKAVDHHRSDHWTDCCGLAHCPYTAADRAHCNFYRRSPGSTG